MDAILITHEHIDHTKSLGMISSKYNIPIYTNEKTWNAIGSSKEKVLPENINFFSSESTFSIGSLEIYAFSTPHDAAEPCGFYIKSGEHSLGIATDLGHVTPNILKTFSKCSDLLLESNYAPEILKVSSYPYALKQRIFGPKGHLSNDMAGEILSKLVDTNLKNVLLIHLSKENNFPELAKKTVLENVQNKINIDVAPRNSPSKFFKIS